jgi:hypothetical protein
MSPSDHKTSKLPFLSLRQISKSMRREWEINPADSEQRKWQRVLSQVP